MATAPIAIKPKLIRRERTFPGKPNSNLIENYMTIPFENNNDKNNNYEQSIFDPNQASPPNFFLEKLEQRMEKYYASKKLNNE